MTADDKVGAADTKSTPTFYDDKYGVQRSSDTEVGHGDVEIGQVETTKRGLKARHAQMIALGGTIG